MKKLLLLPLMLVFTIGCASWYKHDRPSSQVPKAEVEQDKRECERYAAMECAKVGGGGDYNPYSGLYVSAYGRCKKIHEQDCLSKRGWHKKPRQRRKEDPKPEARQETKIELGEGNEIFRKDVSYSVIAYYNSHGISYDEKALATSIEVAERILMLEQNGHLQEYFDWLENQPEYTPIVAEYHNVLYECVKRHVERQEGMEQK